VITQSIAPVVTVTSAPAVDSTAPSGPDSAVFQVKLTLILVSDVVRFINYIYIDFRVHLAFSCNSYCRL
jgi:hypothetical protein